MHLFYTPGISGDGIMLSEQESSHAMKVLRLKRGDYAILVDGFGGWYEAEIKDSNSKKCELKILSKRENYMPLSYHLHIGIAPTKNIDRFEWFIEKATEIGISEITPLLCDHSERKQVRSDRLEKIIISAMKQSRKAYKPILNPMSRYSDWIKAEYTGTKAIGYCSEAEQPLLWKLTSEKRITIAIGPEGDFSPDEIKLAIDNTFTPVSLGNSRLRTETAGVVSCSCVNQMFG